MSLNSPEYEDTGFVTSEIGCKAYFARKRGRGHIESGKTCQDYCLIENLNDNTLVIAAADGHGGEAYVKSDIGARIACEAIVDSIKNIFKTKSSSLTDDTWVEAIKKREFKVKYINSWKNKILADYADNSANEQETSEANIIKKYGTTILFAIITRKYYVLGQLGDGAILMFNDDNQCQLFKRHAIKTSSRTSSLASNRAEYAFMIDFFRRELFGNILISTDGIYDKLDKEDAFLTYAASLRKQLQEKETIETPFEIQGIDVSEISKDDCTIALIVSDTPTQKYELNMPPWCECRNITFTRVYNGLAIYQAYDEEDNLEIHVVEEGPPLGDIDIRTCLIPRSKGSQSIRPNKRMFSFALPRGLVRLQKLIEYGEHLEKKYPFNDRDYTPEDDQFLNNDLYSNQFWMDIYEKIILIEKEFEILKIYPLPAMFDTAYITTDKEILIFPDTLKREGYSKEKLSLAFNDFYERFSILGKLSCGKISIPLFRCATQGQNINMLHTTDMNTTLCRVIYNESKKIYGLFNLSSRSWNIEGAKRKEIAPQGVLRLNQNHSFTIENIEHSYASGSDIVDGFARYEVKLFGEIIGS